MENWFIPDAAAPLPPAQSVLVLAPHPDDEVFGCGGCAALYARAGVPVQPLVLTDGGGYLAGDARAQAVALRRDESRQAAALLGTLAPEFGAWQDRQLSGDPRLAEALRQRIEACAADVVFAPSLWEVHPDHRATAWALVQAARSLQSDDGKVPTLAFYEVGAPLRPNHLVDISAVQHAKQQAMAAFASQLASQRYDVHIAALNTFRTYSLGTSVLAAEALILVTPDALASWANGYAEAAPPGLAQTLETALQKADGVAEAFQQRVVEADQRAEEHAQANRLLNQEVARLADLVGQLQKDLAAAEALSREREWQLQTANRELRDAQQALQDVFASRSWRVTRPLRWITERLR